MDKSSPQADNVPSPAADDVTSCRFSGIELSWQPQHGGCTFEGIPVTMMWIDSTLAGLMAGVQAMVGTERFLLALQCEGRNSVEDDWGIVASFDTFPEGFDAIAKCAAVAGWGRWELVELDDDAQTCIFRVHGSWESKYQHSLGQNWGSAMVAGKLAGLCSQLFSTHCWADQTRFEASDDAYDEFCVHPSERTYEAEIRNLLETDSATRADMAVALERLRSEIHTRKEAEVALRWAHSELESRVKQRTEELAQANTQLRHSEASFRNVIESSPMGILNYELNEDEDLILLDANPAAIQILGIVPIDLYGKRIEEAFPMLEGTEVPEQFKIICQQATRWHCEQFNYDHNDTPRPYELYAFQTSPGAMCVMFTDITERLAHEQERASLAEQLSRSRRMEALGLLAGGVAHDLNNILSGVTTYPELLISKLPDDHALRASLETIRDCGQRAADVVQDLLTMTRSAGAQKEAVHLNGVIDNYLRAPEFVALRDAHPHVSVDTRLCDDLLNVNCSKAHIRKLMLNLVTNAYEATDGDGCVQVTTENRYMDRPLRSYDTIAIGEYVVLAIRDDGPGVPDEDLERIFDPFYSRKILGRSGTGLGLTLVWNCVRDHDGYIDVTSSSKGTCFEIYLPATRQAVEELAPRATGKIPRGNGQTVLVIDDEALQRDIACQLLTQLGYETATVSSGDEALDYLSAEKADILVLDMIMPGGKCGRETYEEVLKHHPGQRAIIASGYAETDQVHAVHRMGAGPFLSKPYTQRALATAVRDELAR